MTYQTPPQGRRYVIPKRSSRGTNHTSPRPINEPPLYEERFHWFRLLLDFRQAATWTSYLIGAVLFLVILRQFFPPSWEMLMLFWDSPALRPSIILGVFLAVMIVGFQWPRAYWIWKHTLIRVGPEKTTIKRDSSFVWGVKGTSPWVHTYEIINGTPSVTPFQKLMNDWLNWEVSDVSLDTNAQNDQAFKNLRYIKDGERLEDAIETYKRIHGGVR